MKSSPAEECERPMSSTAMTANPSCERFVNIAATTLHQKRVDLVHKLREGPRLRRRHTKSRNGCVTCKQRRIKVSIVVFSVRKSAESNADFCYSVMKRSPLVIAAQREESIAFGLAQFHLEPQAHLRQPRK
jgi:hypothetical protein